MSHTYRYNNNINIFSKNGSKRACLKFLVIRVDDAHKTNDSVLNGTYGPKLTCFMRYLLIRLTRNLCAELTELGSGKGVNIFRWVV